MKCECECHCGGIPSRDAMNDRLYRVEIVKGPRKGGRFAAWRGFAGRKNQWVASVSNQSMVIAYADDEIRIIHEIIQEE